MGLVNVGERNDLIEPSEKGLLSSMGLAEMRHRYCVFGTGVSNGKIA